MAGETLAARQANQYKCWAVGFSPVATFLFGVRVPQTEIAEAEGDAVGVDFR